MCLAIPGKIIEIKEKKAIVDFGGIKREADISFVEDLHINDFVLVHVGFAIQKVEEEVARETYRLLAEIEIQDELAKNGV
ncbi:HypC/HybG/HupF family hydrogenase formation chaperone [Candidatus Pacearchaeota archaeon CG10_big_fil_rev_8_21_14_0_10_32_14]|nr:MAG: HypC/HybG/HupF family hydrogenase formation chaperone [Candidatus Pacearchaeota archaeon CG10_big_fil_rev_8_21_14_0_10_32_14]